MSEISVEEKLKFLLKLAKLQGFVGILQIKDISNDLSEEKNLTQKLEENSVEINHFLKTVHNYKTASYQTKKENKFMLTTRTDENGESFLLGTKYEKELFEKLSSARNNMLEFAFKNGEIREFMYEMSEKIVDGTIKISSIVNCEKENESVENCKGKFIETVQKIKKNLEKNKEIEQKTVNLFFALNLNEKTKGVIYNKYKLTKNYKNEVTYELYKWEQIYSNSKREIIEANIRLVFSIAKEYCTIHKGILDISDIIQEGNIGLINAVESFDIGKGNKFSSWAVWYIRRQIWYAVNSYKNMVYIPSKASTNIYKMLAFEEKYKVQNGKSPTIAEIAKEFNLKEKQIISLKSSDFYSAVPNYEATLSDDDSDEKIDGLSTFQRNPFDILAASILKKDICSILDKMGERERRMIELYFGLLNDEEPMGLSQIGELYGLSSERVRQIIEKNITNIRNSKDGKTLLEDYKILE
ncbi:MAG: sigma-70 family RNA polymerase sigma factor [Chitinispirillales bacterium]|jgi:RNA polymerase primary sigma factor|nr:sigma-70 family RNA polymerase sigma factor [Chitinispirillales bacterium]